MRPFRILVTGWRNWPEADAHIIGNVLHALTPLAQERQIVVVDGECPYGGVDRYANLWASSWDRPNVVSERHPADWNRHGRGAGPIRNGEMVALGADYCAAFPGPGCKGTWDCMKQAVDAGIPVLTTCWTEWNSRLWRGQG